MSHPKLQYIWFSLHTVASFSILNEEAVGLGIIARSSTDVYLINAVNVVCIWIILAVRQLSLPYLSSPVMINDLKHFGAPLSSSFLFLSPLHTPSFQSEILTF